MGYVVDCIRGRGTVLDGESVVTGGDVLVHATPDFAEVGQGGHAHPDHEALVGGVVPHEVRVVGFVEVFVAGPGDAVGGNRDQVVAGVGYVVGVVEDREGDETAWVGSSILVKIDPRVRFRSIQIRILDNRRAIRLYLNYSPLTSLTDRLFPFNCDKLILAIYSL